MSVIVRVGMPLSWMTSSSEHRLTEMTGMANQKDIYRGSSFGARSALLMSYFLVLLCLAPPSRYFRGPRCRLPRAYIHVGLLVPAAIISAVASIKKAPTFFRKCSAIHSLVARPLPSKDILFLLVAILHVVLLYHGSLLFPYLIRYWKTSHRNFGGCGLSFNSSYSFMDLR